MALPLRSLALHRTLTATRTQSSTITITRALSTSSPLYKDEPRYPFTKPDSNTHQPTATTDSTASAYPFTNQKEPVKVSPPNRPMGHMGPTGSPVPSSSESSSSAPTTTAGTQDMPHQPDYNVATDYRASAFSPVPMHVQDGSEPGDLTAAAVLSGAPTELQARTVRIFRPAKTATQSGDWHAHHWQMDWDVLGKGHRWENPVSFDYPYLFYFQPLGQHGVGVVGSC